MLDEAIENRKTSRVTDILEQVQNQSDEIEYKNFPTDDDVIIDIRDPDSIKKSKLKVDGREVLEIPFYDINNEFSKLDQSKKYLLSCEK
ncbi:MAG: thiazole biosynthesis protein [Patescibacteria group bacterium]